MATTRTTDAGDTVYVAPERAKRPRGEQPSGCPFCPGNEAMTPPTLQQIPAEGTWRTRAFQNRFPITQAHEVVVDTPRHVLTFAHLEPEEADAAFRLYRDRAAAMQADGLEYLLFRNEGPNAGGSIPHTHAQIVGEPDGFPRTRRAPSAPAGEPRTVHKVDGFLAQVPSVGRFPYEVWIRPATDDVSFHEIDDADLAALSRLVLHASRGMRDRTRDKGWNLVLHRPDGRWRFEFLSRTEKFAGLELGADVYVNAVDDEAAAQAWSAWFASEGPPEARGSHSTVDP